MDSVFGSTPAGILVLDAILLVLSAVLIPLLYAIFKSLREISGNAKNGNKAMVEMCALIRDAIRELTEARVRDERLRSEIERLRDRVEN